MRKNEASACAHSRNTTCKSHVRGCADGMGSSAHLAEKVCAVARRLQPIGDGALLHL